MKKDLSSRIREFAYGQPSMGGTYLHNGKLSPLYLVTPKQLNESYSLTI